MTSYLFYCRHAGPAAWHALCRRDTPRGRALALATLVHALGPLLWLSPREVRAADRVFRRELDRPTS